MSKRYTTLLLIAATAIASLLISNGNHSPRPQAGAAEVRASRAQMQQAVSTIVAGTPMPASGSGSQSFVAASLYPTADGRVYQLSVAAWPTAEAMHLLGYTPRGAYGLEGQSIPISVMSQPPTPTMPASVYVPVQAAADYQPPTPPIAAPAPPSGVRGRAAIGDYHLLGSPSISVATIERVLASYHSPAVGSGQAVYDLGVKYGVDPAFALAVYVHESSAGTMGAAVDTRSWGNIICPGWAGACIGRFRAYDSYVQAAEDWYQLITGPLYIGDGLDTPMLITPRYAPDSDNNDSNGYAQTVMRLVDEWRGEETQL